MTATTPYLKNAEKLGPLSSCYVDVETLPWKPTPCRGIDMKILLEDKESGLMTALFRWQPGAELALHEHVEVEQTFVIEGSLIDDEGEVTAGNYVWRPKGNRHIARSPRAGAVDVPEAEHFPDRRGRGAAIAMIFLRRPGDGRGPSSRHSCG